MAMNKIIGDLSQITTTTLEIKIGTKITLEGHNRKTTEITSRIITRKDNNNHLLILKMG